MKRNEIEIGKVYVIRVSGKLAPVRITHERTTTAFGTRSASNRMMHKFMGINEKTGRSIGPFTAAKCRIEVIQCEGTERGCYRAVREGSV